MSLRVWEWATGRFIHKTPAASIPLSDTDDLLSLHTVYRAHSSAPGPPTDRQEFPSPFFPQPSSPSVLFSLSGLDSHIDTTLSNLSFQEFFFYLAALWRFLSVCEHRPNKRCREVGGRLRNLSLSLLPLYIYYTGSFTCSTFTFSKRYRHLGTTKASITLYYLFFFPNLDLLQLLSNSINYNW